MKKLFGLLLALTLVVTLAACGEDKTFTIAFLPNETTSGELSDSAQMLADEIQEALGNGYTVDYVIVDDYSAVTEAILTGTAQIAWESGATFTGANLEDDAVIPLVSYAPNADESLGGYPGYIATHIDNASDFAGLTTEAEKLAVLKDKSFAFVSATSTSGRLVPTTTFWNAFGPDGTGEVSEKTQIYEDNAANGGLFSEIIFSGTHQTSAAQIFQKDVYAGAFCCTYGVGTDSQGNAYTLDDFYIISEALVPNGPLWVNSDYFTQEEMDAITDHLVGLNESNAADFFDAETGFFFEYDEPTIQRFFAVDVSHYDFVKAMYAE